MSVRIARKIGNIPHKIMRQASWAIKFRGEPIVSLVCLLHWDIHVSGRIDSAEVAAALGKGDASPSSADALPHSRHNLPDAAVQLLSVDRCE